MIARFFAAVSQRRRVVLVVALVVAAGYVVAANLVPAVDEHAHPIRLAVAGAWMVLALVSLAVTRPRGFVLRSQVPAFNSVAPRPTLLFLALALLTMYAGTLGDFVRDPLVEDRVIAAGSVVVVGMWVAVMRPESYVQLRPDGLWQRGIKGSLVVPWEAEPIAPALPPPSRANTVRLRFGRPDLVRRGGLPLFRNRVITEDIDPRLLAAAIRYYTAHPEHRSVIGTQGEYSRVMPLLLSSMDWSPSAPAMTVSSSIPS